MEKLTYEQERRVENFSLRLRGVVGPWDLFPPDELGVRAAEPEPRPELPAMQRCLGETVIETLCYAAA
jgi:hypothetical protein